MHGELSPRFLAGKWRSQNAKLVFGLRISAPNPCAVLTAATQKSEHYPHFMGEAAKARKCEITCPTLQNP